MSAEPTTPDAGAGPDGGKGGSGGGFGFPPPGGFGPGFGFSGSRVASVFATVRRASASWRSAPSWLHRVLGTAVLLVIVGLAAVLLVVGLVVGAAVAVVAGVVLGARAAWARLTGGRRRGETGTPGLDAMRSNVRVIARSPGSE